MHGFIDAMVNYGDGNRIMEIKTKENAEALSRVEAPETKHMAQIQSYMATTGIHKGYLMYATRSNPTEGPRKAFEVNYDPEFFEAEMAKLERARATVRDMIDRGVVSKQELYSPLERFRVLADVAPYSKEYEYYKQYLTRTLQDEQKDEFVKIKDEVSAKKKRVEVEPYMFKYSDIVKKHVMVKDVIGPGVFTAYGIKDPIRLAGISVYRGQDERGDATRAFEERYLNPGSIVTIGYTKHKSERVEKDTYGSVHAAVWSGNTILVS